VDVVSARDTADEDLIVSEQHLQLPTGEIRATRTRIGGSVLWFSGEKGYGFIRPEDGGDDVFVRHSSIDATGFRTLREGERVTFERGDDGRGPRALRVRPG
jgi:cold shock protein